MKKGKIVSMPTSLDAQIRTRARNLPLDKCYVNHDWEDSQMVNVVISRKHVNGNITFGIFLVDLLLLGVRDCLYEFNVPAEAMDDVLYNGMVRYVECDYTLAHNIVFEGIAFAEENGFEPYKNFTKTGIYILEEDSDDIPQIEIPVGENEKPVVWVTPENNMKREIAILEKTVGKGNFIVYYVDDEGNFDDDDDFDDEPTYHDVIEEIQDMGIENYLSEYEELSPIQLMAITDIAYHAKFGLPNRKVEKIIDLILEDERFDPDLENMTGIEQYFDRFESIFGKLNNDEDAAVEEMEALAADYPDDPNLGVIHINLLKDTKYKDERVGELTKYWYERASEHYAVRLMYAQWLCEQELYDEVFEFFDNKLGLDALTTENVQFTDIIVSEFCACYVNAWLSKDNLKKAEPYYSVIHELGRMTPEIKSALVGMMLKRRDALTE